MHAGHTPADVWPYDKRRTSKSKQNTTPSHCKPEQHSVHLPDELVDIGFPVTEVTALDEVLELPCPPAASGVRELEWPEEVGRLLEVGAGGVDLVHEILDGEDVVLAEGLLNDGVVGEGDALLVDLAVAALVDKLTDRLQVGLAAMGKKSVLVKEERNAGRTRRRRRAQQDEASARSPS